MSDPPPSGAEQASGGVLRSFTHRPRLLIGAGLMVVAYLLTPGSLREPTRLLIAWNVGAWVFLALVAVMISGPKESVLRHAHVEDENQWTLLLLGLVSSGASLAAIVWELGPVKNMLAWQQGGASGAGRGLDSLRLDLHQHDVRPALRRRLFQPRATGKCAAGFDFPKTETPGWIEFFYQAFAIGCTFASSDVNVTSSRMRRIVASPERRRPFSTTPSSSRSRSTSPRDSSES